MRRPGPSSRRGAVVKPKKPRETIRRILSYMREYRIQLVFVFFAILFSSFAGIAGTYFLKPLINIYIVPAIGHENPDLSGFVSLLFLMGAIYAIGALSTYVYNRLMINVATGTLYRIRTELFNHMQGLPIQYFDSHTDGELMSRFTNDTDTLRDMLSQGLPQLVSTTATVIGVFTMMLILSPALTFIVVAMLIIMLLITSKIGKRTAAGFRGQQEAIGKTNGYIEEMIEGQKVVKVFTHEKIALEDFSRLNEKLCKDATSANTFANILMPILGNLSYMLYAITAVAGGIFAIMGRMDLGTIASFLQYTRTFSQPITQLTHLFNSVLNALAGAERVFEMIDQKKENDEGSITLVNVHKNEAGEITETEENTNCWAWKHRNSQGGYSYTQLRGEVKFENVTFSYDGKQTVLKDVSLYARAGQKIALVGSTGAGKTTITNLLNRFYDISEGKIIYDNIAICDIRKDDLRRSLGMVLQDTHLFTGTVMENIRYGNLKASDEEVKRAAKLANADSFIMHLPQGYETVLTADGSNLSQGQRQLLSISRAAVANSPVLVLDEATSSIDTRTEALIEKGMNRLMENRTVFVIAHRLSTVRNADVILVLEQGRIIERGNHEELLAQKGRYYQLHTGMFEFQ